MCEKCDDQCVVKKALREIEFDVFSELCPSCEGWKAHADDCAIKKALECPS
jgi:hypothetical protein